MRKRMRKKLARQTGHGQGCAAEQVGDLSESLEDYLEAIYELQEELGEVRVRDIAQVRGVRMPSVVDALRRLRSHGLVSYQARELVTLTPEGLDLARKVTERHEFLKLFFTQILGVDPEVAERDACSIEHHISPQTLSRLASFYQFLTSCPKVTPEIVGEWQKCCAGQFDREAPDICRFEKLWAGVSARTDDIRPLKVLPLSQLQPGQRGVVMGIRARRPLRLRLVELGVLPKVPVEMEGAAPLGDPIRVKLRGYRLSLRKTEAESILVGMTDESTEE